MLTFAMARNQESGVFVDNYLLYLLARASEQASRQFHAHVKEQGLSVPEWRVLAAISDRPMKIGELARITLCQQPTLTKVVDRMCKHGLVNRVSEQSDKRVVLVQVTATGSRIAKDLKTAALVHEDEVLQLYDQKERAHLKGILSRLIARTAPPWED